MEILAVLSRTAALEGIKAGNYSSIFNLATFGGMSKFALFIGAGACPSLILSADFQRQPLCVSHGGNVQGHDEDYFGRCSFLVKDEIDPSLNDLKAAVVKTPTCNSGGKQRAPDHSSVSREWGRGKVSAAAVTDQQAPLEDFEPQAASAHCHL